MQLRSDDKVSATATLESSEGPTFKATSVYVVEVPGIDSVTPFVFVIEISALDARLSVSVALLFDAFPSEEPIAVAVLFRLPDADASMLQDKV